MGTYVPPLPLQNYVNQKTVVNANWLNAIDNLLQGNIPATGVYQAAFVSGQVQVTGPGGNLISYGDLTFGLSLPTPGGFSAPTLLIGGAGKNTAQITTDAQIPGLGGIDLFIVAGSAPDDGGSETGGVLWDFAGPSFGGRGGDRKIQAGTSLHGPGGDVYLFGGNNTSGDNPAGNIYMIAGTTGNAGGNIKMYATNLGGNAGDISFWLGQPDIPHSVPLWTMSHTGALFPGNQGAGNPGDTLLSAGNLASPSWGPVGSRVPMNLTLSGATTTTPTGGFFYSKVGSQITIWTENNLAAVASGPNDIILSTLPSAIWPSASRIVMCSCIENAGGQTYFGHAQISTVGGITISLAIPANGGQNLAILPGNFASGSSKGVLAGWTITYAI